MTTVHAVESVMREHGVTCKPSVRRRLVGSGVVPAGAPGRSGARSPEIDLSTALRFMLSSMTRDVADMAWPLRQASTVNAVGVASYRVDRSDVLLGETLVRLCDLVVRGEAFLYAVFVSEGRADVVACVRGEGVLMVFGDNERVVASCYAIDGGLIEAVARMFGGA